jgi:septal ring factor EnvC (AmiA/AmiB activator)
MAFAYFSSSRKTSEIEIMKALRHRRLLEAGDPSQPILYLELRKDRVPVDPMGAVNEGQKVRG